MNRRVGAEQGAEIGECLQRHRRAWPRQPLTALRVGSAWPIQDVFDRHDGSLVACCSARVACTTMKRLSLRIYLSAIVIETVSASPRQAAPMHFQIFLRMQHAGRQPHAASSSRGFRSAGTRGCGTRPSAPGALRRGSDRSGRHRRPRSAIHMAECPPDADVVIADASPSAHAAVGRACHATFISCGACKPYRAHARQCVNSFQMTGDISPG